MAIKTLIIGFTPIQDVSGKKSRELKFDQYFKGLLSDFYLGEVHFVKQDNFKEAIDKHDPFFVIVFDEFTAREVKGYKKDVFVYVTDAPSRIFYRKAEIEEREKKQRKTFEEISGLVKKLEVDDEKGLKAARQYAGMSYNDTYDWLIQMIISDREDLRQKAWDLLLRNDGHPDFVWMRAQLLCEVWDYGDGKKKEEFLCMAMDQHIENGMAEQLEDFTDVDEQIYHQYMFHFFDGSDANYIRRIPIGQVGQDKYAYEALLKKYDTPNGVQMMMEAGQMKSKKEEYFSNIKQKSEQVMDVFNLAYKHGDKKVYFTSLHLQGKDETRELIFKFIWKKELPPKNFYDAENQIDTDIKKIDHITFHKDGRILMSYYKPKKAHYFERKLQTPISKLPENSYIPLFVFSVNSPSRHAEHIGLSSMPDIGDNVADLTWDAKEQPFSVGVFVVRNNFDPSILEVKFPGVFVAQDTALFPCAINKSTGLLLAFSKKLVIPRDNGYISPKHLKNADLHFDEIPVIGISLIPSDERIRQLIERNPVNFETI